MKIKKIQTEIDEIKTNAALMQPTFEKPVTVFA